MRRKISRSRTKSVIYGVIFTLSLAALEPGLGRLSKLGEILTAKQYLQVAPLGQFTYFISSSRGVPISVLSAVALFFLVVGLVPAIRNLKVRRFRGWTLAGWVLLVASAGILIAEFLSKGEWMVGDFLAVRYLALGGLGLGAVIAARSRSYFCAVGVTAFCWDISAAFFWAWRSRSLAATVPVPYFGGYESVKATGLPCWAVIIVDACFIIFFLWFYRSRWDPLRVFPKP